MRFQHEFVVAASPDEVWELFGDVSALARCLPGATLRGRGEDGSYEGVIQVKLGPMSAAFDGSATVESDDEARRGRLVGTGLDRSGGSRGRVQMTYAVGDVPGGTGIAIDADITLSGAAAQLGRPGLIEEMARRMIAEFSACLERVLSDPADSTVVEARQIRGLSLFFASLWSMFRRMLARTFGRGRSN